MAIEGQKQLEIAVQSAHQILNSLNEVLSNPALWEGGGKEEAGWAAVDDARQKYKAATTALRGIVAAIFNHPQMMSLDVDSTVEKAVDQAEIDRLQKQTVELREEIVRKNDVLKQLITQMRELVRDISMWQTPPPS
ncbi:hypothetical protein SELMODRAFT_437764 [Selaginella moellendorffii]|uniref:Mediator of RNA polymerase II transcription subunit 30 n=1 Tax=Selaginella moellendorffii TaxID=88036 RepID=D8QTH3_SELML|nr:mediator of RNA polymerase II transcription subunit 30 [Selaginella moellendorffii]EFJ36648.1 hypothetical protein SELMODRAFT_437764 [Selaginella moellendorffii]|eukprot:XP_002961388.1 mediator of RNA polymerase II transcription subunit 30 [Selaginella moellendorffii]